METGPARENRPPNGYNSALLEHYSEFLSQRTSVILGDFNNSHIWNEAPGNNKMGDFNLTCQKRFDLVSAYHDFTKDPLAEETQATHFRYRKVDHPYHIDHIFMPKQWTQQSYEITVGKYDDWSTVSDHCPMTLSVTPKPFL